MTRSPVCLPPIVNVGEIYDLLTIHKFNCFPIIDDEQNDILLGTVLRKVLTLFDAMLCYNIGNLLLYTTYILCRFCVP
jgi:CBS domain-containing protein